MSRYTIYNVTLAAIFLPGSWQLLPRQSRLRDFSLAARIGLLIVLVGFPWDYFAIRVGAWRYPEDPGVSLHGVPVNDLILMWLCTCLTTCALIRANARHDRSKRHPEGKHTSQQDA